MAVTINWNTKVISVPKSFMVEISPTLYELDVNALRIALKDIEDSPDGMAQLDTHRHNSPVTLAGVTYARSLEIINGYTVTFEDGQYTVKCLNANHNLADVKNLNQVSLIIGNAAGLVVVDGGTGGAGASAAEVWSYANRSLTSTGNTAIADAVRTELTPELDHIMVLQNGEGLSSTQATMLLEIYRLYGLDPTRPLVVTQTNRSAGGEIAQTITGNESITTITRT